jgi:hypothetical protein
MHFDSRAVERYMVDLNVDDIVFLQRSEDIVEYALFGPTVRGGVYGMPISES